MRCFVLTLSLLGTLLFGGALVLSFVDPLSIERAAREIVRIEIERRIGQKLDQLSDSRIGELAQRALQQTGIDIAHAQEAIRVELPRKVVNVIADMLNANCECRKRLTEYAHLGALDRLSSLIQVREKLVDYIESAYASVTRNLIREFRIFTASNALAFALLGVVTLIQRRANLQLALPAVVLIGAVAVSASLYLFNQNWLHTIVFGEYVGLAYSAYLVGVALFFTDIVFNRARVSTGIVRLALEAVGSSATVLPC
jgi:hypothetical protein